ncbi:hypothetical protein Q3A66_05920 [Hymenobacter sp. BT770]|uniref:hypothetical protein n=1 Tax=Hymenobacter sp. BT770 TaxID=2886942 RepID=UPI001D0FDEAC|nr:hypothetical protein [Hymenobacter sp. BT770]MCC3152427.1 hypothetical protein [Hymenobacter sp. BT770]MDO3414597.1 hypothetical protein [Hymenobacter sp. BT770]
MRVFLLVGGLLLGSSLPAFCQGRDTVFAVHKLFRAKRSSAKGLQAAKDSVASTALYAERMGRPRTAQEARQDALASTGFAIASVLKAGDYSAENEAAIIQRYQAGGSIPPAIRRKLKRKHFHRTSRDIVSP